jgi:ligand-binding sensor domain-containing protein
VLHASLLERLVFGIIGLLLSINSFAQNPVFKRYGIDDGLPTNEIYQIMQDKKGYIWLGTSKGAVRFDGNRFENFTIEDGLPDKAKRYAVICNPAANK